MLKYLKHIILFFIIPNICLAQITESFDSSLNGDWVVVDATNTRSGPSSWSVSQGELIQTSNIYKKSNKIGTYLYYDPGFAWEDVSIQWTQTSDDDDGLGLMFRYTDNNNYYRYSANLQQGYRRMEKNIDGVFTILAEDTVTYTQGVAQAVRIETAGDRIQVFVDSTMVFDVADSDHAQGTLAFYSYGNTGARFDNLIVDAMGSNQNPPPIDNTDLLSHWTLDESNGLEAADSLGNNPGTLVNAPIWQAAQGQLGGALKFDGNDDRVDLGILDVSGTKMSLSFWFNADDFDKSDARFISKATSTRGKDHYWMVSTLNQTKLRFRLKTNGVTTTLISPENVISPGQWHHVAATYDGNEMQIYRDGELVASTTKTGDIDTNNSVPVAIGNQPATAGSKPFDGLMDDVRIYTTALTIEQIEAVMVGNTPPPAANQPPIAVAGNDQTIMINTAESSSSVVLDGEASYDSDGSIAQFEWRNQDNGLLGNSAIITASLPLGAHLINLTVTDNEGATDTDALTVNIQSETVNDTPPSVSITSPANAATISSTVNLSADAADDHSIVGVQFQIDGVDFGSEDTLSPYSIAFDSTAVIDGSHTITAIATDSANQIAEKSIDITVSNANLPPLACADGLDNDGDGLFDYPEDLGCISLNDNSEVDSTEDGSWTTFTPSADTRIVYVSDSTGNDSTCGSYAANQISDPFHPAASFTPCKTISTATTIYDDLSNNEPHWILFKSGDTWTHQSLGKWEKSGRSLAEPALLASYGDSTERPKVLTGESSFSGAVSNGVKYVTIADLFIHAHTYTNVGLGGPRAFRWISDTPAGDWVFEGLHVQDFSIALLIGASQDPYHGSISNVTFRNNTFNGNQGENAVYMSGVNGLKIFEGNTFYDNAYTDNHTDGAYRGKHIYVDNENGYAPEDPTGHSIYRNNFFIDATAYGFTARTGGEIYNNYVESHGFGIQIGNHDSGQTWPIVPVSVHDNVVMHLGDSLDQSLGYGINIENSNADVERNIIAYYSSSEDFGHPFWITGDAGNTAQTRLANNTIYSTIGNIRGGGDTAPIEQTDNLINEDMDLLATNTRSSTVNFVDPDLRDLAKYNRDILGGSRDVDAFMVEALKQWRGNFRPEYTVTEVNDYIRRGFEPDGSQPEMCNKGAVPCGFSAGE